MSSRTASVLEVGSLIHRAIREDPAVGAEVEGGDEVLAERGRGGAQLVSVGMGSGWAWVVFRAT